MNTIVFKLNASDADTNSITRYKYLNYSLDESYFRLNESTGYLYVHKTLDYEQQHEFHLKIQAYDPMLLHLQPISRSIIDLNITLIDLNDNGPIFLDAGQSCEYKLNENIDANTTIGYIRAKD